MMKRISKAFERQLFGVKYERLKRAFLVELILFWGLHTAELRVQIAPFILFLMTGVFTAKGMQQALSSKEYAASMQNLCMLPFEEQKLLLTYTAVLGFDTLWTKTGVLLVVLLAVSDAGGMELFGSILCAVLAAFLTAAAFCLRRSGRGLYELSRPRGSQIRPGSGRRHLVWRYFLRYLRAHPNYLINMVILWVVAAVLPRMFWNIEPVFSILIGLALLSFDTPVSILLSCDPDLERAVRFLPGQRSALGIPYCLFLFLCGLIPDCIFLISWKLQKGGAAGWMAAYAVCFSLQSAISSVLLEWRAPIRGWKLESDLWHHPRKYIVPAGMILLAGVLGMVPEILPLFVLLLSGEVIVLLHLSRR